MTPKKKESLELLAEKASVCLQYKGDDLIEKIQAMVKTETNQNVYFYIQPDSELRYEGNFDIYIDENKTEESSLDVICDEFNYNSEEDLTENLLTKLFATEIVKKECFQYDNDSILRINIYVDLEVYLKRNILDLKQYSEILDKWGKKVLDKAHGYIDRANCEETGTYKHGYFNGLSEGLITSEVMLGAEERLHRRKLNKKGDK